MKECATDICTNTAKRGRYCFKCISRKRKEKDPVREAYHKLKSNAKRRGKYFDLTLEQFRCFCIKTKYISKRGRERDSYHIDREDESGGYTINNIQLLTNRDNVIKYKKYVGEWTGNGMKFFTATVREPTKDGHEEDCPF